MILSRLGLCFHACNATASNWIDFAARMIGNGISDSIQIMRRREKFHRNRDDRNPRHETLEWRLRSPLMVRCYTLYTYIYGIHKLTKPFVCASTAQCTTPHRSSKSRVETKSEKCCQMLFRTIFLFCFVFGHFISFFSFLLFRTILRFN